MYDDDEEGLGEGAAKFLLFGVRLDAILKVPGLLIMQYLFFWNWKRIVDPNSWGVVLAGFLAWLALAGIFALLIMSEGT